MTLPQSFLTLAFLALFTENATAAVSKVCNSDADCVPQTKCVQMIKHHEIKRCLNRCDDNTSCEAGETCDPTEQVCRLYCDVTVQCPEGYACKPATGHTYKKCTKESSNTQGK